jgi:hypothetical protein
MQSCVVENFHGPAKQGCGLDLTSARWNIGKRKKKLGETHLCPLLKKMRISWNDWPAGLSGFSGRGHSNPAATVCFLRSANCNRCASRFSALAYVSMELNVSSSIPEKFRMGIDIVEKLETHEHQQPSAALEACPASMRACALCFMHGMKAMLVFLRLAHVSC